MVRTRRVVVAGTLALVAGGCGAPERAGPAPVGESHYGGVTPKGGQGDAGSGASAGSSDSGGDTDTSGSSSGSSSGTGSSAGTSATTVDPTVDPTVDAGAGDSPVSDPSG